MSRPQSSKATNITEDWYSFSSKLPLYRCMHLLLQVPIEDLDYVIGQLKLLRKKQI